MEVVQKVFFWLSEKIFDLHILIKAALAVFILLNVYSYVMTERPVFFYNRKVTVFNKLLEESSLANLNYRPYFMAPNPFM